MKLISGYDKLVCEYVSKKTGEDLTVTPNVSFAIFSSDGIFLGGIVVHNFRGTQCEISVATETPSAAKAGILRKLFEYVFYRAKCQRVLCMVKSTKETRRSRRFLELAGFVLEGNLRKVYADGSSALMYGLLAEECRFLAENKGIKKHGWTGTTGTDAPGPLRSGGGTDADQ